MSFFTDAASRGLEFLAGGSNPDSLDGTEGSSIPLGDDGLPEFRPGRSDGDDDDDGYLGDSYLAAGPAQERATELFIDLVRGGGDVVGNVPLNDWDEITQGLSEGYTSPQQIVDQFQSLPKAHQVYYHMALASSPHWRATDAAPFLGQWGVLDPATKQSLKGLYKFANDSGQDWRLAIRASASSDGLKSFVGKMSGQGQGTGVRGPIYRPPDPATLRENIRQNFQQSMGREPLEGEMEPLVSQYSNMFRQAFNAQVANKGQVDPNARFNELLREKYAKEFEIIDQRQEQAENMGRSQMAGGVLGQMMGAGERRLA